MLSRHIEGEKPSCQVMVSSTMNDLPDHRERAKDAIIRAGCMPVMMEHSTAEPQTDAIDFSLRKVEQAEIYVGVFALRYGYIPEDQQRNPDNLSITELEYRHAKRLGKKVLIFIASDSHSFLPGQIDQEPLALEKRQALYRLLTTDEIVGFFNNPDDLGSKVYQAIIEQQAKQPKEAPNATAFFSAKKSIRIPPELWAVPAYTLTNAFIGRSSELDKLDIWADSDDSILVVEGIGGLGKSALTWEWLNSRAEHKISDLYGRLWWSFYEQTSLADFARHALAYLTEREVDAVSNDYNKNARELVIALNERPSLLVLDGFERSLTAYHRWDKAQQRDDQIETHMRGCTNPADAYLLKWLASATPSKILISSRLFPYELENVADRSPIPGVAKQNLDGLSEEDTLQFIRHHKIEGDAKEILRFADRFGRHSLVLKLVCGMISFYRADPKNFDAWLADPNYGGSLRLKDLDLKQTKTHILEFALSGLSDKTRQVLQRIAVLSEDVDYDTIKVLNPYIPEEMNAPIPVTDSIRWQYIWNEDHKRKVFPEHEKRYQAELKKYDQYKMDLGNAVPDFDAALDELCERGLLQWDVDTNRYNMHPVVRGSASDQIEEQDRKHALKTARDHFAALPEDDLENATDIAQISNSMNIYYCLIGEGLFEEGAKLYEEKLFGVIRHRFFAFDIIVEHLEPVQRFIDSESSAGDIQRHGRWLSNSLAKAYDEIGKCREAEDTILKSLESNVENERWNWVIDDLSVLWNIYVGDDRLAEQARLSAISLELSEALGVKEEVTNTAHQYYCSAVVRGQFREAESISKSYELESQTERPNFIFWTWFKDWIQGKENDQTWQKGYALAQSTGDLWHQEMFLRWYAVWALEQSRGQEALGFIDEALALAHKMGKFSTSHAVKAWALAKVNKAEDAVKELNLIENNKPGYASARAWLEIGEREKAKQICLNAYAKAWGIGAPFSEVFTLGRSHRLLLRLGEKVPELPNTGNSQLPEVPFEKEISAAIARMKTS